ncbi:MAG: 2-amino-4-hydroxy-6-hydroxymethyldihydropteridine diphosphokinase [Gammaproteobacteria bacterium]|nr:2-amino-4-hydroxy-6-hydroxymethyldihydropteridine diphosphokinase [Gammaproteobacteria bacterium]
MSVRIWLSLGSNIERERNIRSAVAALQRRYGQLRLSPVYESAAVGFEGDPFFNLVVGFDSELSAPEIAADLRRIEALHGRERTGERYHSRTLDIDLLTYGNQQLKIGDIHLPRDEITRYAFVLRPLAQVAPGEIHPLTGKSYRQLWDEFDDSEQALWPVEFAFE